MTNVSNSLSLRNFDMTLPFWKRTKPLDLRIILLWLGQKNQVPLNTSYRITRTHRQPTNQEHN